MLEKVLEYSAARAYYDRFGEMQDRQGFYEDPALNELIAHASFHDAQSVFEFGCGTGKFADWILKNHLPSSARYLGCDISPVMVGLAKKRLEAYGERAKVILSDGTVRFPLPDHSVDHIVSSYVLDILSEEDIQRFLSESRRVVSFRGKICLASLTRGVTIPSRIVSSLWMIIFRMHPSIVGGCRPIHIESYIDKKQWQLEHQRVLTPFGVSSEVLILISMC
ncbi:class I SAM-dependent methyltransferase [Zooshikella harenae]|uniref:Class I SAM-dependent methyltransferase n=1 Tax=Zooshikella harenae TaxID=2827238 RepID=A0ABS5ZDR0_9GAMM|nr:class I SAM-dependent methyltransferase [Zooshikella harenae]MBU2712206.1 class I SAM-dependent methyltransferase [Zooshikella harenae]